MVEPNENPSKFRGPSKFIPPLATSPAVKIFFDLVSKDINALQMTPYKDLNLSKEEYLGLQSLKQNKSLIIKEADKGGNVVIKTTENYSQEAYRQLNDSRFYAKLPSDPTPIYKQKLEGGAITRDKFNYLQVTDPIIPTFYMLRKVHKNASSPPGRPIVSSIGSISKRKKKFFRPTSATACHKFTNLPSRFVTSSQPIGKHNGPP